MVLPWYVRSYLFAGNPVWPLANSWFGGLEFGQATFVLALLFGEGFLDLLHGLGDRVTDPRKITGLDRLLHELEPLANRVFGLLVALDDVA